MSICSADVKKVASEFGADLCGIASIERFIEAPKGFHPSDILPMCQSVIILASHFLKSTLYAKSTIPYTTVRNELSTKMNGLAIRVSEYLEERGAIAVPMNSIGPDEWDAETNKFRGIISLKHAAVLAGLGKLGKNTLLINEQYGNMLWLSGVFTAAELEPDPLVTYEGCLTNCKLCLEACPVNALDGITIQQQVCKENAFGEHNGGEWRIKCYSCRKVCPNCFGISSAQE
jgi:epoxyqueuosine reductase